MSLPDAIIAFIVGIVLIVITAPRKDRGYLIGWWHSEND